MNLNDLWNVIIQMSTLNQLNSQLFDYHEKVEHLKNKEENVIIKQNSFKVLGNLWKW